MNRAHVLWLLSLSFLLVFLALEPLLGFALFGSDTGEYYRLTSALVATGHLPHGSAYLGWGFAYPDFPGIFLLAGAGAGALGTDPLTALTVLIPVVAVLSVAPLFLLFRRIFPNDTVAILGSGFASVFMPRLFSIAHPAPLALGDCFAIAGLWMFVEGRRDARWYLPLALTSAALIVTHHLSSYFFLASALGSLVVLELWRPGSWSLRFPTRELVFATVFVLGLLAYWSTYATSFAPVLAHGALGLPASTVPGALGAATILAVALLALVLRWRRRRAPSGSSWTVRFPSDRSVARDALVILGATFGGIGLLVAVPLPATSQTTVPMAVLFFSPLLATMVLAAGTRRLLTMSRLGPLAIAWLTALGASAVLALATHNSVILPSRHAEYLLIPAGLLVAIGAGRIVARWGDRSGRRALVAGAVGVVVVLAANAAIVYPPPSDFGNFQEGLTLNDAALWMWIGIGVSPNAVIASDHRLSSMIFGFDGNRATWDSTPALFNGGNRSMADHELRAADAPHGCSSAGAGCFPVNAVAVDQTMRTTGVALDPSHPASPISPSASAWFNQPPFVVLYENGGQAVYWVDAPLIPSA